MIPVTPTTSDLRFLAAQGCAPCTYARHIWNSLPLQVGHRFCCRTPAQRELLEIVHCKITGGYASPFDNYWSKLDAYQGYGALASILACADYLGAADLIRCGYQTFRCQDRLCPRCSYRRLTQPQRHEFGDAFPDGSRIYFIVLSLSRNPDESARFIFRDLGDSDVFSAKARAIAQPCAPEEYGLPFDTPGDLIQCRLYWDLVQDVLREFTGLGKPFAGAIGGPELAVQLQPLRVIPHANYITWSDGISAEEARWLRRRLKDKMRNSRRLTLRLLPTIACYRLGSPGDLYRVIGYINKPIDIPSAYSRAADRVNYVPEQMVVINRNVTRLLENLPTVFYRLPRIERLGVCHSAHRGYIGQVTSQRQQRRERAAQRREDKAGAGGMKWQGRSRMDGWLDWLVHDLAFGSRLRQSRFERWQLLRKPLSTPPIPPPPFTS